MPNESAKSKDENYIRGGWFKRYGELSFELSTFTTDAMQSLGSFGSYRIHFNYGLMWGGVRREYIKTINNSNYYAYYVTDWTEYESHRIFADVSFITDLDHKQGPINNIETVKFWDLSKRLNASITYHFRIPGAKRISFFAQTGYMGSDTYNAYFQQSLGYLRMGIGFGDFIYKFGKDFEYFNSDY